jgi:hypothetical protein
MYRYTVRCEFPRNDRLVIESWLDWLRDPHIADVMKGGASGAEVVAMSGEMPAFEIRYRFDSKADFDRYQREVAPKLREEGLQLFPPEQLGVDYSRTDGEVIYSTDS